MDCYAWVDLSTAELLLIPISDDAETFLKAQFSGIEEKPNTSLLLEERKASLCPTSGSDFTKLNTLIEAVCSHDDIDHRTCKNDPNCDEKLRILEESPPVGH